IINSNVAQNVVQLSADHSCTTFVTLLAALNVLLYGVSKQNDFITGIHSAGQLTTNAHDLVGYCINLLPVRARIDDELSFNQYLDQLKTELLDVYAHQNYPLGRLIKKLNPPRDSSRAPLIAVTINVDRVGQKIDFHDLEVEAVANHNGHSKFDVSLNLIESAQQIEVECDYNTDLFDAETIQRWLAYFEMTLLTLLANPDIKIRELKKLIDESDEHHRKIKEEEFKGSRRQKLKQLKRRVMA
ncbi:MAG TPA: condensation domain-containing protein, partial [Pyrinomonadaceae bacterium]|nr:condensation domain-containing protein [Pyrinomonadaceae bacterium]